MLNTINYIICMYFPAHYRLGSFFVTTILNRDLVFSSPIRSMLLVDNVKLNMLILVGRHFIILTWTEAPLLKKGKLISAPGDMCCHLAAQLKVNWNFRSNGT